MKYKNFNIVWKMDPMSQSWLLEDPASKQNFKCKVCQSTLELGNMGKGAVVMQSKSVKHVQNSESWKSSSAAILASWTGAKNLAKILPPPSERADDKILLAYVSDDFKTDFFFEQFFLYVWKIFEFFFFGKIFGTSQRS